MYSWVNFHSEHTHVSSTQIKKENVNSPLVPPSLFPSRLTILLALTTINFPAFYFL